jgi:hypothetical protein
MLLADQAPAVWFAYSPDRKEEHPQQHLSGFKETLNREAVEEIGAAGSNSLCPEPVGGSVG